MTWASFQVCDDYRLEADGKATIIGVYPEITFPSLPARMMKLIVITKLRSDIRDPRALAGVKVQYPGADEPIYFPTGGILPQFGSNVDEYLAEGVQFADVASKVVLSDINFPVAGRLKVWAVTELGEDVYAGSLPVRSVELPSLLPPELHAAVTAFYAKHATNLGSEAGELAQYILEAMANYLPASAVQESGGDAMIIGGRGRLSVFFGVPRPQPPKIKLSVKPEHLKTEVVSASRFGFEARITPADVQLEELSFEEEA
ncbi:hypothetical protein [Phaeospirillum tilakii]|uniref:Uncharacterized protein n=1 Tax=Phaeospirillum tilakii TaxID=741673 RepID=A0ABW5CAE7_9PROT